ncbi:hypothetical protein E4U30_005425 [Claviceps sp. LM220 group G6]|nr:hypothetical protein E4U30_005425 [Claviceps sp. LM220 group G6]
MGIAFASSLYALFENDVFGLSKLREFIYDPSSGKSLDKSTSAKSYQTSTSSTASSGGPQDVSDAFGTSPESLVEKDSLQTEYHHLTPFSKFLRSQRGEDGQDA